MYDVNAERFIFFWLSILLVIAVPVCAFQISEICPDTYLQNDKDEYLVVNGTGSLAGLQISDGEGTIQFPPDAQSSGTVTVAESAEAFRSSHGHYPDYEIEDSASGIRQVIHSGHFKLSNKAENITLFSGNVVIQKVNWPGSFKNRQGQVHFLGPDGRWDPRILMLGGSSFESKVFPNCSGSVFVSPDCSREIFEELIDSANNSILLNVYEFTDAGLAESLCLASSHGVRVMVLIEGGPVGGISTEEKGIIAELKSCGIPVYEMGIRGANHTPYRFDHAKYLVVDGLKTLVISENFKFHSLPEKGTSGNRGWGAVIISRDLADFFSSVFLQDLASPGVQISNEGAGSTAQESGELYTPTFSRLNFSDACIIPVLAPDTSYLVTDLINRSQIRLSVEEAYIKHYPKGRENPYLNAVIQAARRGVTVRVLLDSSSYNTDGSSDNDEMVAYLSGMAEQERIPLSARLIDLDSSGLLKLHTKGLISDDAVLISSINWNENSPTFNREVGVIIEDPAVAEYFSDVFERDWSGRRGERAGTDDPNSGKILLLIPVLLSLAGLYLWRRKRW